MAKKNETLTNQRLFDLVRISRAELLMESRITDEEFAELASATGTHARLDDYDALREHNSLLRAELARLTAKANELEGTEVHAQLVGESGLAQVARWVREYKADHPDAQFDSGLRCVSDGGVAFFIDPEEVEAVMGLLTRLEGRAGSWGRAQWHEAPNGTGRCTQQAAIFCSHCGWTES